MPQPPARRTPQKICFFTDSLEPSGVGVHLAMLIEGLVDLGHTIHLVCLPIAPSAALIERAVAAGAVYHPLTVRKGADLAEFAQLVSLLRDLRIDLVHVQNGVTWEGHFGVLAARRAGVPAVLATEHLPFVLTTPQEIATKAAMNTLVDCLITVSVEAAESHRASGTTRPGQVLTIPNGVPQPPFTRRDTARAALRVPPGAPVIGVIARLSQQKGLRYLLDALPALLEQHPSATLAIVGDGPLRGALERQVEGLGVRGHVQFHGDRPDAVALLAGFDVAVLPSLFEGMPLSVLEAMAVGRPVVGTRVSGTTELIEDGRTGFLVPPRDPVALAAAIGKVLAEPALARSMGRQARVRFEADYHIDRMVARTAALYQEQAARPAGGRMLRARSPLDPRQVSRAHEAARVQWRSDTLAPLSDFPVS